MSERRVSEKLASYLNPVSAHPFADPFVMKHCGEYWGYSTGFWRDGRCFGILRSSDLVQWEEVGGAMEPLPGAHTCYWAPEVSYDNGQFLLYYSVGNETRMQIRVAVADDPAGPFVDSRRVLTAEEFAIDPHVFIDDDGQRYLFYATDFLTHTHIGTGTVMDRMLDSFTLAGEARPVSRARYDWQVYDPHRVEKGGVRWHTVEGPCVLKRKNRYFQLFSGGNWQNVSYGVSYAFTDDIETKEEWQQASDGVSVLPILRTLPGQVIGPGHNCAVRGPDNQQWFCVYHRWAEDNSARVMCIDRLDWVGQDLIVLGPSASPQPAPIAPTLADSFTVDRQEGLGDGWDCLGGRWSAREKQAWQEAVAGEAEARARVSANDFVAEVSARVLRAGADGGCGIVVRGAHGTSLQALVLPEQNLVSVTTVGGNGREVREFKLPADFAKTAFHLFRVEVNGLSVRLLVDDGALQWEGRLPEMAETVSLSTLNAAAAFAGFALTAGWQDLFTQPTEVPADDGWKPEAGAWVIVDGELRQTDGSAAETRITKTLSLTSYELVINARMVRATGPDGGYGFSLNFAPQTADLLLATRRTEGGWSLMAEGLGMTQAFPLPKGFDPNKFHQFRFRKERRKLSLGLRGQTVAELDCEPETIRIGLISRQAEVAFEMVRVTAIGLP